MALGNVIANLFKPTRVLGKPVPAVPVPELVAMAELEDSYGRNISFAFELPAAYQSIVGRLLQALQEAHSSIVLWPLTQILS
jgi:hypothetical protein